MQRAKMGKKKNEQQGMYPEYFWIALKTFSC